MSAAQNSGSDAGPATAIDVREHMGLVHTIARRYSAGSSAIDYDDLVQVGLMGIVRAAETYDPERAKPSTYLAWWIRQAIGREVENHASAVRIPVGRQYRRRRAGERMRATCLSLDAPIGDGSETHLDRLAADGAETPDALAEREQEDRRRALARIMSRAGLDLRERRVMYARVVEGRTLREIGAECGLSREAIRIVELKALRKLREAAAEIGEEFEP